MKTDAILAFINDKSLQFEKVRRMLDNEKLGDENTRLKSENVKIKDQIEDLVLKLIVPFKKDSYDPRVSLHEVEKMYVLNAVKYFGGNKTQTAEALGIGIKTLYNKLHEYGEI